MNGKFFDLKKEKQDRMINAALKIFALHGYRQASTDDIVKEASISKGLLFHYFQTKIGLYSFIYDYSVRYMALELKSAVHSEETNIFTLLKQAEYGKMLVLRNYPYMQQFLNKSLYEDVSEVLIATENKKAELLSLYESIYQKADFSSLPPSIEGDKLIKMLEFTMKGLMTERFQDASFHPDMLYQEIEDYISMMEQMVYPI